MLVAASSGSTVREDGTRLTPRESQNNLIRNSYDYLTDHSTDGKPLTTWQTQADNWNQTYPGNPAKAEHLIGWYTLREGGLDWQVVTAISWEAYYSWIFDSGSGFFNTAAFITLIGYCIQWGLLGAILVDIWMVLPPCRVSGWIARPLVIVIFTSLWAMWVWSTCLHVPQL